MAGVFVLWVIMEVKATRWLSWYGVGLASADRLPVVVRIPAGPLGSLKCDPPKGNGRRPQKRGGEMKNGTELVGCIAKTGIANKVSAGVGWSG